MIRTTINDDDIISGETGILIQPLIVETGESTKGIVMAHGSGDTAIGMAYNMRAFIHPLARHAAIHIGDYGGQTWGSDTVVSRIAAAIDILVASGVDEPVALIGASMGGCSVLNFAVRYPERISCVAAMIPLVDLADARANPWLTARWPEIDAIYGSPPAADYSGHNPVDFATDLDADLPIHIWSSSDDGLARRPTHEAFMAARPQTGWTDMGSVGHTVPTGQIDRLTSFIAQNHL